MIRRVLTLSKKSSIKPTLDHEFTSKLLALTLQVNEAQKQTYSPKICRFLISKRAVSQSMVKGGLTRALAEVHDWVRVHKSSIMHCLAEQN